MTPRVIGSTFNIVSDDIVNGKFTAGIAFEVDDTTNATFTIPLYGAILSDLVVEFPNGEIINAELSDYMSAADSVQRHQAVSHKAATVLMTFTPSYMKIELKSAPRDIITMKFTCYIKTNGAGEWILPFVQTKNLVVTGKLRSPISCNIPLLITETVSDQAGDTTRYSTFTWQSEEKSDESSDELPENICIKQGEGDLQIESKLVSGDQNSAIALYVKGPEDTPRDPNYFAFLCDSSGSMDGERINLLKDAIMYFLQNLAEHALDNDMVSLFWFNTNVQAMIPRFVSYGEFKQMEEEWKSFILHEYADGCTELFTALDYISTMSGTNPTHIVVYTDSEVDIDQEDVKEWKRLNPNKRISTLTLSDEANPAAGDLFANETNGFSLHLLTAQLKGEALYATMTNVMRLIFHNVSYISAKIESDEAGEMKPWTVWGSTLGVVPSGENGSIYFVGNVIQTARVTLTICNRDPTGKQVSDVETRVLDLSSTQNDAVMKRAALETKSCFMKNGVMDLTKWLLLHRISHDKMVAWFCLGQASQEYESNGNPWDDDRGATGGVPYYYSFSRCDDDFDDFERGNDRSFGCECEEEDEEDEKAKAMQQIYDTLLAPKLSISQYMKWFSSKEDMFVDANGLDLFSVAFIYKIKLLLKDVCPNMISNLIAWVLLKKEFNKGMFGFYEKRAKKALESMGVCESIEKEVSAILKLT
jgi:hypothetical protein